jgi:glycosyltransferase involved in cell wall biosynthesis
MQVDADAGDPAGECLDVLLALRGRRGAEPARGGLNLLWQISHPDDVGRVELNRYDGVLVASRTHALRIRGQVRPPVEPLLQFTDPDVFHPPTGPASVPARAHEIAFVGNWRSVVRRIVWDALASGQPLALYGRGWERIAPEHAVAEHVPHDELREVYSSCKILLCDHWDDMRKHGFVSNRIFDALACGAFVIADDNPAIAEELPGAVETYRDHADLATKLDRYLDDDDARARMAATGRALVLERHTADHRADELLAAARTVARACDRSATRHIGDRLPR